MQLGHRHSIDLDLFGNVESLLSLEFDYILSEFGHVIKTTSSQVMIGYSINNVKVDIVKYKYPLVKPKIYKEGIRMASPEDIAAMKFAAISGRGKKKDFYDLYELLQHFTLDEMFGFYREKYSDGNEFIVLRSLAYFEDADPILYNDQVWEEVKSFISKKHMEYLHNIK